MENHYNCIYMYVNKINGKYYIGQTKNFNRRHKEHIRTSHDKTPIDKAFNKYGEENFNIIILKENISTQCLLNLWESYYINKYNCLDRNNYNIASGGSNGNVYAGKTEEEMNEIRNKMKENHHNVDGENNPMYGKGYLLSGENCYWYGKQRSEETKQKISNKAKERLSIPENCPMHGKHHSEETKRKISESLKGENHRLAKKVLQYDKNNKLIKVWNCISQASEELGIDQSGISKCCKGKLKTCGGFVWKYADEIE